MIYSESSFNFTTTSCKIWLVLKILKLSNQGGEFCWDRYKLTVWVGMLRGRKDVLVVQVDWNEQWCWKSQSMRKRYVRYDIHRSLEAFSSQRILDRRLNNLHPNTLWSYNTENRWYHAAEIPTRVPSSVQCQLWWGQIRDSRLRWRQNETNGPK